MGRFPYSPRRHFLPVLLLCVVITGGGARLVYTHINQLALNWPTDQIAYFDASEWPQVVDAAADKWNATGANIKLARTNSRSEADVIITSGKKETAKCRDHIACVNMVGWIPMHTTRMRLPGADELFKDRVRISKITTHEFGHVLGLAHSEQACSVMRQGYLETRCPQAYQEHEEVSFRYSMCPIQYATAACTTQHITVANHERYVCGPFASDIKALIERYGGEPTPVYRPHCQAIEEIEARSELLISGKPREQQVANQLASEPLGEKAHPKYPLFAQMLRRTAQTRR